MTQIGISQPVTYIPGQSAIPQNIPQIQPVPQTQNTSGYAYGDDVFQGNFEQFKDIYSNFDSAISKYSPFFGKMGTAQTETTFNQQSHQSNLQVSNSGMPPIPQSALNTNIQIQQIPPTSNGELPQIPQSALNTQGTQIPQINNPQVQQVPSTLPIGNNTATSNIPKKNIPSGPVITNIQQQLQQEVQKIQTPQKAIQSIAGHAMLSRQERTLANDVAWGAKYYANQAQDLAQKLTQNKRSMTPGQVQSQLRTIENYKIKAVSLINDAKKKAINNYNEALKATMLYNNFFTEKGQYASVMMPNDRQFVESEIDKTWDTWSGGFEKEVNGITVHADDSVNVVDKAAQEIAIAIDKADKAVASIQ